MDKNVTVKQITDVLNKAKNILITIHESPDGDAVGSMLALYLTLGSLNKKITMYSPDVIPAKHRFMIGWDKIVVGNISFDNEHFDVLVMLDCGDRNRSGRAMTDFKGYDTLVNIDHHISNNMFGDINFVDARSSCTGEEVYAVVKALLGDNDLTADISTALLTALYDDTGGMRYVSTTSKTLNIAADLVDSGANCAFVSENLFFNVSKQRMSLAGRVLATLTFEANDKIAYMVMSINDLKVTGAVTEDSEGLIDFPRSIQGVEVAFLIKEVAKDKFKISFRSRGKVDVNEFCSRFGGGGHKVAAGCTIKMSLEDAKKTIINGLKELI